jgi:hypothetical protein
VRRTRREPDPRPQRCHRAGVPRTRGRPRDDAGRHHAAHRPRRVRSGP